MDRNKRSSGIAAALRLSAAALASLLMFSSCTAYVEEAVTAPAATASVFPEDAEPSVGIDDIEYTEKTVPVIHITTSNGKQVTSKTDYSSCNVRFELNGIFAEYENTYTDENGGNAEIRCRGNSSYTRKEMRAKNKYSYKLRLETKADLFGLGENRHWYLINNWFDVSALRNKLAYDFSGALGLPYTGNTWVELYYNGEYRGLYLLTESIRIDEGRVETTNWEEFAEDVGKAYASANALSPDEEETLCTTLKNNLRWITTGNTGITKDGKLITYDLSPYFDKDSLDLTSGYLIELDGRLDGDRTTWKTRRGAPLAVDSPARLNTNSKMMLYVYRLVQDFEDALFSPTFHNSDGKHYSEYLDVDSLVDYWLVWNLFNNQEFGYLSMYCYIDGGKIHFGHCWDFDYTAGNIITQPKKWISNERWLTDRGVGWYKEILGDPYFSVLCQERWFELRELTDDLLRSLDIYYGYMADEAVRCNERNGDRPNWSQTDVNNGHSYDFQTDYEVLKSWLTGRIKWLNDMMSLPDANIDKSGNTRSVKLFTSLTINGETPDFEIVDGRGVYADYVISPDTAGEVTVTLSTTHTTSVSCSLYLNGTKHIGDSPLNTKDKVHFTFNVSDMDLSENAINVLYIPTFRTDGTLRSMTSILIRVSSVNALSPKECAVILGNTVHKAMKGEEFTLPEITEVRDGFLAAGWTDGTDTVLPAGSVITPNGTCVYYVRWIRTEIFSAMKMYN
ncbi:MAG: CotH kinase family protein [Clostridia bacterium]|nr:CotH kinase family protein [Clostridia bacterium]